MKYTLARYTVRPDKVREFRKAIAEFVAEVSRHEPRTLYLVFGEEGQHTFVHWMAFEDEAAERRHALARYNDRFVKKLLTCSASKPTFNEYRLFASSRKHWPLDAPPQRLTPHT